MLVRHALDPELAEGAIRLVRHRVGEVRRGRRWHDQLGQQRVEARAGAVAGVAERVDPHAAGRRRLERGQRAAGRARACPSASMRLHVDAHLERDSRAAPGTCACSRPRSASERAGGDLQLHLDQVECRHLLGHRVLDLQAGVGLDEREAARRPLGGRRRPGTRRCPGCGSGSLPAMRTAASSSRARSRRTQAGRRGDLDQLLMPALDAALALPQVGDRAGAVADDLHLDVAGAAASAARRRRSPLPNARLRLRPAARVGCLGTVVVRADQPHAATAAAGHRLDHASRRPGRGRRGTSRASSG